MLRGFRALVWGLPAGPFLPRPCPNEKFEKVCLSVTSGHLKSLSYLIKFQRSDEIGLLRVLEFGGLFLQVGDEATTTNFAVFVLDGERPPGLTTLMVKA